MYWGEDLGLVACQFLLSPSLVSAVVGRMAMSSLSQEGGKVMDHSVHLCCRKQHDLCPLHSRGVASRERLSQDRLFRGGCVQAAALIVCLTWVIE